MKKINLILTIFIIAITILTRFVGLDRTPPHLSNDEISIAYDAYSISNTLRDEHNQFLPISFQSHGTYKAPLSIYLTAVSVSLLGNNEFSARFPSAILGGLTIFLLGLFVYELTGKKYLAFLASGILSVSPWHIYTSRMALETNIALFFLIGGIYLFFVAVGRNKSAPFLFSFIFFALSMYGYHTEWGLTPLIVGSLFLLYRKTLIKNKAYFVGLFLLTLLVFPLFINFLDNRGTNARANTEFLFTQDTLRDQLKVYDGNYFRQGQIVLSRFIDTYSSYVEPDDIYFASPNLLAKTDPFQAGLILAPFFPIFIYGLFKIKKYFTKHTSFIYIWLAFSPVVPALTVGEQHVVRNLPFIAPSIVVIAVGCHDLINKFRKNRIILISYGILISISFFYFCITYFFNYTKESGVNYQYGYKQIADFIKPRYEDYDRIIIDPIFGEGYVYSGVPHLYIPFFTSLDPKYLQEERDREYHCGYCFAKYEIREIDWVNEVLQSQSLYVVPDSNKPPNERLNEMEKLTDIKLPNQKPAFVIYHKN